MAYNPEKLVSMGRMSEILARTKQEYENKITTEAGGALYQGTKTDLNASDSSVIEAFFTQEKAPVPRMGMCSW